MKKFCILTTILILLFFIHSNGKDGPDKSLSGFLGVKWGDTVTEFLEKVQIQKKPSLIPKGTTTFAYFGLNIAGAKVRSTFITFAGEKPKMWEKDYDKFFLEKVDIRFDRKDFKKIYKYFKKLYGKPKEHKRKKMVFVSRFDKTSKPITVNYHNVYWRNLSSGRQVIILSPGKIPKYIRTDRWAPGYSATSINMSSVLLTSLKKSAK